MDLFQVDKIVFLLGVSRNIRHVYVDALEGKTMLSKVFPVLKTLCNKYGLQGFKVRTIHADPEFKSLRDEFIKPEHGRIGMHICAPGAHVPEAERNIRTVKERNRSTVAGLPYKYYPRILKVAIVCESARYLNMFPQKDGVSEVFSPSALVDGQHTDYDLHCKITVGHYAEVHDEPETTNTETVRTTSGIALGPAPELDGTWEFMSLQTGKKVTRRNWSKLPITSDILMRVHDFATIPEDEEPDSFVRVT